MRDKLATFIVFNERALFACVNEERFLECLNNKVNVIKGNNNGKKAMDCNDLRSRILKFAI